MFVTRGVAVLQPEADPTWGTGPTRIQKLAEAVEGRRAVDLARVPAELAALRGVEVVLHGPRGRVCSARLGDLSLLGYYGGVDMAEPDPSAGDDDRMPSMPHLVAELAPGEGDCAGALWARKADLPAPLEFAAETSVDRALAGRARVAVGKLDAFTRLKGAYAEYLQGPPPDEEDGGEPLPWEKYVAANLRVDAWKQIGGERRLVVVQIGDLENVRCGYYFAEPLSAVFELAGDRLTPLSDAAPWRPAAIFDADGDGALEVLAPPSNELGGILHSRFTAVDEVRFPSDEC